MNRMSWVGVVLAILLGPALVLAAEGKDPAAGVKDPAGALEKQMGALKDQAAALKDRAAALQKGVGAIPPTYMLTGPLVFVDRLGLTEDQQKVVNEICDEWADKRAKALADIKGKIGKLTAEDQKDPEKVRDYQARMQAAMRDAQTPQPEDQIRNILTPEQTEKLDRAGKVLGEWSKWLTEYLAKSDKDLEAVLGPLAGKRDQWASWRFAALNAYLKGAADVADRIGLTKDQEAELQKLSEENEIEYQMLVGSAGTVLSSERRPGLGDRAVQSAVSDECRRITNERLRVAIEKLLTEDQRDKLGKAAAVMAERNKGLAAGLAEYTAKIDKVLPPVPPKPGEPYYTRMPGGGISVTMPARKPVPGPGGEVRKPVLNGPGGEPTMVPREKAPGEKAPVPREKAVRD